VTAFHPQEGTVLIPGSIEVTDSRGAALHGECTKVSDILSRIGDTWSVLIIMMLSDEPKRFNALRRSRKRGRRPTNAMLSAAGV
jgi:DNA-binding HxlR family transcriptional regulator